MCAQVSSGVVPVPTGTDLSNSYRWFSTCLLSILRDVPSLTYRMIRFISKIGELPPNLPTYLAMQRTSTFLERTAIDISPDRESWTAKDSASIRTSITRSSMTPSMSSSLTSGLSTLPSMLAVSHFVFLVLNKNGSCNSP